jgi:hypothetical protein
MSRDLTNKLRGAENSYCNEQETKLVKKLLCLLYEMAHHRHQYFDPMPRQFNPDPNF